MSETSQSTADKTQNFIEQSRKVHGNKYDYTNTIYVQSKKKVIIYCNQCKKTFEQTPSNHLKGNGCRTCGIKKAQMKQTDSSDTFISKARKVHGNDKYDYTNTIYINTRSKVIILCIKCNKEFTTKAGHHISGSGCPTCAIKNNAKSRSRTTDQFIQEAIKVHGKLYSYEDVNYINDNTKVSIYCNICNVHFPQVPRSHLAGNGCPTCARKRQTKSLEVFKNESIQFHGPIFDLSKVQYKNMKDYIELTCLICNINFKQIAGDHLRYGCNNCAKNALSLTTEQFIQKAKDIHGNNYDYSETNYQGTYIQVIIKCNICNFIFNQIPHNHLQGRGCPECAKKYYTTEEFVNKLKYVHGNLYDYSNVDYKGWDNKINIKCNTCGNIFDQIAGNHIRGRGCSNCSSFKSEKTCREIFEYLLNAKFSKQRPEWLYGLELDGYNEELNIAFEYQGKQHYEYVPFIHKNYENFELCKERDIRKKQLCQEKKLNLIEIPYEYSYENDKEMMKYIIEQLEPLGYLFIFPKLDLSLYMNNGKINIPKKKFSELKNVNSNIVINSITTILNTFEYPLLPNCENYVKDVYDLFRNITEIKDNIIYSNILGIKILNFIMLPVMITAHKPNKPSYIQCWNDLYLRKKLIKRMIEKNTSMNNGSLLGCYRCEFGGVYNFPSNIAKSLFNYYNAKHILDPCAGYGGRLLGFWSSNAITYTGIDPNKKIPYNLLINTLQEIHPSEKKIQLFNNCAEEFDYSKINPVDFIFTSPPYFNLEIYSHDETQSCIRYPTYEEWLEKFLFKMISSANIALIKDGYFCINIKEYKNKGLINSMKEYMKSINLTLINEITMIQPKRYKNNKNYERIYIFRK